MCILDSTREVRASLNLSPIDSPRLPRLREWQVLFSGLRRVKETIWGKIAPRCSGGLLSFFAMLLKGRKAYYGSPVALGGSWGPFRLVKTEEMRSGTSKSLGLAEVGRLKTQPNRRISRFLRPKPRNLRVQMASETSFWLQGAQKTLKSEFSKMQHLPHENHVFLGPGGAKMEPKWLPKCFEN